jgi:hypothetical protein
MQSIVHTLENFPEPVLKILDKLPDYAEVFNGDARAAYIVVALIDVSSRVCASAATI